MDNLPRVVTDSLCVLPIDHCVAQCMFGKLSNLVLIRICLSVIISTVNSKS